MLNALLLSIVPFFLAEKFDIQNGKLKSTPVNKGDLIIVAVGTIATFLILKNYKKIV